jgi:Glycine zipper
MMRQLSKRGVRTVAVALGGVLLTGLSGCNDAMQGGASGAALGALAGMGLGSLSGNMGKGAAAGAIIGGLGGAILGDQNARRSGGGGMDY